MVTQIQDILDYDDVSQAHFFINKFGTSMKSKLGSMKYIRVASSVGLSCHKDRREFWLLSRECFNLKDRELVGLYTSLTTQSAARNYQVHHKN